MSKNEQTKQTEEDFKLIKFKTIKLQVIKTLFCTSLSYVTGMISSLLISSALDEIGSGNAREYAKTGAFLGTITGLVTSLIMNDEEWTKKAIFSGFVGGMSSLYSTPTKKI
jgi:hypothetical protein